MTRTRLDLTRPQVLAFRRRAGALDERLPPGRRSLRRAAWAGLQDSTPRAALLSIHAQVEQAEPSTWGLRPVGGDRPAVRRTGVRGTGHLADAGADAGRRRVDPQPR